MSVVGGGSTLAESYENPILPHARLREMFRAILEAQAAFSSQDAWAISSSIALRDAEQHQICAPDPRFHASLGLALGLSLSQIQAGVSAVDLQKYLGAEILEHIYFALGASTSLKTPALVVLTEKDLKARQWTRLLEDVARLEAPMIFAVRSRGRKSLAALSGRLGVPGIPVDAADPIALYRVASECFVRARAGGGPALIEAITFPDAPDALTLLRRQMICRGAATERWASALEARVRRSTKDASKKVH